MPQAIEKLVRDLAPGNRHGVCIKERKALIFVVKLALTVIVKRFDLLFRQPKLAADRSIDVLSKLAPVKICDAPVNQRLKAGVD